MFIAYDSDQSFDVATAFTVKIPDSLNTWLTLPPLDTFLLVQSQKSHSILAIFPFVFGSNTTDTGDFPHIESTFTKKLNHKSLSHIGVWSELFSNKETTIWLLSSTIHTGFFFQSQSISSSQTFPTQSWSVSYWFRLYTYGQLSSQFVIQSQS